MKIAIGADHAGLELKNKILSNIQKNYQIIDVGAHNFDPNDDYPDFSQRVAELISDAFVNATKSSFPVACLIGAEYSS